MGLDIYFNIASQPSRTVVMFLDKNNIKEVNKKSLNLFKSEHKTTEYLAINPNGTVPAAVDDGFAICQSSAIVKYIFSKFKVADHWYPADLKQRARVDEILDWYPSTLRKSGVNVFFYIAIGPHIGMPKLTDEDIDNRYKELDKSLTALEDLYLKDQKFLCGDKITIADLFCANEVYQPTVGLDRDIFEKHPRVKAWMDRVRECMNPVWDKAVGEFKDIVKSVQTSN